jgi:hypothetical protein
MLEAQVTETNPVLSEPSCYHFRVLDPRVFAIRCVTVAAATTGSCSHI